MSKLLQAIYRPDRPHVGEGRLAAAGKEHKQRQPSVSGAAGEQGGTSDRARLSRIGPHSQRPWLVNT
ncbi:MAG: hypothetical protein H3C34_15095 [Caldilineaceae bacterium]|nr:hypothetical protein [Caldilineaceae bacterium]